MDLRHKSFKPCKTMALGETTHTADSDLFGQELCNIINLRHPLVQLSPKIDWGSCESGLGGLYAAGVGRPGHPIRLMVALQLLKHACNVSDEEVVSTWVENPYWQSFCGEPYLRHDLPIDPSLMTGFRKRIGQAGCEFILGLRPWVQHLPPRPLPRHQWRSSMSTPPYRTRPSRFQPTQGCCTRHA